jgi:serine phosphatase RsbU (regulator of sigma subunit)/anti-sigma regulatory factor (Ser/Thr protein kinase)
LGKNHSDVADVKRFGEPELSGSPSGRLLQSIGVVMARTADVIWQANATGIVTSITPCRPAFRAGDGELDEPEVQRIEQLWKRCVRCAERFNATYHVRRAGSPPRTFALQAIPVLDQRDHVLYWAGSATEIDRFADAGSRFVSEAAAVLSSSLSRATIVNRLVEASVDHFCDLCAVHLIDERESLECIGVADRRPDRSIGLEALQDLLAESVRTRQPLLLLSADLRGIDARSAIVVPLLLGSSCLGSLTFLERERSSSFVARDVDIGVAVGRQLAMALENIKTFEREQNVTERFRFMARVTEHLFSTLDQREMLELVLDELRDEFADYGVAASLSDERLSVLVSMGTKARLRETAEREIVAALGTRRAILAGDVADVWRGARLRAGPLLESGYPRSWMMVPLFLGDTVYGALICCSKSHVYDSSELELFEEIGRRVSLALEHAESYARERRLIATLQQATLPTRLATVKGASLSAIYRPAAIEVQVGGDWYDAYDLDEQRVLLTVGDVTGHGLEASIVMGKLRHAINVVAMYERDPVQILNAAERVLLRRYPGSMATAFVAIFDARSRTLTYANAGHPYPILRRTDGSQQELVADGLPIGLRSAGTRAQAHVQRLDDAALLALYTDGLTEATRDLLAGERRLREALGTDAVFFVREPAQFVERFCLRDQAPDDVAVLLVNFVESDKWTFDSGDWRAARTVRRELVERLAASAQSGSDIRAAELVFGELAANVAQHAAGPMDVALEWRDARAVVHVMDRGQGYAVKDGTQTDLLKEHGRGLWLVQRLGAELNIEVLPGFGKHVRAVLPVRRRIDGA